MQTTWTKAKAKEENCITFWNVWTLLCFWNFLLTQVCNESDDKVKENVVANTKVIDHKQGLHFKEVYRLLKFVNSFCVVLMGIH